jgi:hypothetical protein
MAPRKHADLKSAKAAKQKKIAIVGGVLLAGLLAFSVPKTLKMMHPSHHSAKRAHSAMTATTSETTATPAATTTPATTGMPAVPVSNPTAGTTVLTAQLAPAAREGQLSALSASFQSKDPFKQLLDEDAANSASSDSAAAKTDKSPKPAKPPVSLKVVPPTKTQAAGTAPAASGAHQLAARLSAVISVNGVREGVNLKLDFPADTPVFHLVSLTRKTAKISVVGGSLASGSPTLTLRRGKPLVLVNTADGTRYRLLLVTTSTSPATAATAPTATQSSGTTSSSSSTPPSTTTTQTTTTPTIGG